MTQFTGNKILGSAQDVSYARVELLYTICVIALVCYDSWTKYVWFQKKDNHAVQTECMGCPNALQKNCQAKVWGQLSYFNFAYPVPAHQATWT